MRAVTRWSELLFACVSLLLWSTLPFPPTARVMGNWVFLTASVVVGITFYILLKGDDRVAWNCAGVWAGVIVAQVLVKIVRTGFPSLGLDNHSAVVISFLVVSVWGLLQAVVLAGVIWRFREAKAHAPETSL